jgi:hypothetical protein
LAIVLANVRVIPVHASIGELKDIVEGFSRCDWLHLPDTYDTIIAVVESKSMRDCLRHSSGFLLNFSIGIASVVGGHLSKKILTMDHPFKAVHPSYQKR